jgi:hypothetical protein
MKIRINVEQLDRIFGNLINEKKADSVEVTEDEIDEQEDLGSEPSPGTTTQSGAENYPQVGKWESGVKRGPGNQIGVTRWSEIVGATLTRGKANPLK